MVFMLLQYIRFLGVFRSRTTRRRK